MTINRILLDTDRTAYDYVIQRMYDCVPEMSANKIASALVQQAFVYATAKEYMQNIEEPMILSAGSYQDTAAELLRFDGCAVYDVDPVINCDLHTFKIRKQLKRNIGYDIIISTSVLEHTSNDEEFIADICDLLDTGGYAILTCDFKDDYHAGDNVPYTSNRFYTTYDLTVRLSEILKEHGCTLIDIPDYSAKDTFVWDGINYSFATFVFKKEG